MVVTGAGPGIMAAGAEGAGPEQGHRHQHPAALRGGPRPVHRRGHAHRRDEVLLHPQAHADEGVRRVRVAARRVRHAGRDPRAAHPAPDRQGRARRRWCCLDVPGGTYWHRWVEYVDDELVDGGPGERRGRPPLPRDRRRRRRGRRDRALLAELPLDPLGRGSPRPAAAPRADARGGGRARRVVHRPARGRAHRGRRTAAGRGGRPGPPRPASARDALRPTAGRPAARAHQRREPPGVSADPARA